MVRAGDGVRVVSLNRPAVRNAMTATMARTYAAAIKAQVYADLGRGFDESLTDTLARMDASFDGPDLAEALAARASKRPAVFRPLPT